MHVTIKSITDASLVLRYTGITIRGDYRQPKGKEPIYGLSSCIARHIDLNTEDKRTEVFALERQGFIEIEVEQEVAAVPEVPVVPEVPAVPEVSLPTEKDDKSEKAEPTVRKTATKRKTTKKKASKKKASKKTATKRKSPKKNTPKKKTVAKSKPTEKKESDPLDDVKKKEVFSEPENTDVVIATPAGPVKGKAHRSAIGELPESDVTEKSLEAMRKMDAEDARKDAEEALRAGETLDDEVMDLLDEFEPENSEPEEVSINDEMNRPAIIVTADDSGKTHTDTVHMKTSIFDEDKGTKSKAKTSKKVTTKTDPIVDDDRFIEC